MQAAPTTGGNGSGLEHQVRAVTKHVPFRAGATLFNVVLGAMQYLIQRNWVNASGGYCSISY